MTESQEVAVQGPRNVYEIVDCQEREFQSLVTCDQVLWAKEAQFAKQALEANDFLNKIAWSNQSSLRNAIINVASIGITLNPASKHAYLVPRDKKVCLDISYIGLMHLAMQSGAILWGQAKLVREGELYENNGIDKAPTHKAQTFSSNQGEVIGAYCTVKTPDGAYLTEEMSRADLDKVAATSKASNGPWRTWPEEMMRKTVVKRASKYWPKVDRLNHAIEVINQDEGIAEPEEKDITPDAIDRITDLLSDRNSDTNEFNDWIFDKFGVKSYEDLSEAQASKVLASMEASGASKDV